MCFTPVTKVLWWNVLPWGDGSNTQNPGRCWARVVLLLFCTSGKGFTLQAPLKADSELWALEKGCASHFPRGALECNQLFWNCSSGASPRGGANPWTLTGAGSLQVPSDCSRAAKHLLKVLLCYYVIMKTIILTITSNSCSLFFEHFIQLPKLCVLVWILFGLNSKVFTQFPLFNCFWLIRKTHPPLSEVI